MWLPFLLVACLHFNQRLRSDSIWLLLNAFTSGLTAEFHTGQSGKGALKFR
jgi:hypothetical protein